MMKFSTNTISFLFKVYNIFIAQEGHFCGGLLLLKRSNHLGNLMLINGKFQTPKKASSGYLDIFVLRYICSHNRVY